MGINHADDPRRTCLRVEQWPKADRLAWEAAAQPGDVLEDTVGPAHHWSPQTREKRRKGYGRWLNFLIRNRLFDPDHTAAERVTPANVRLYLAELKETVSSWTGWGRMDELQSAIRVIAPDPDWTWLRGVVRHLEANVRASKDKFPRLRPAGEIAAWAIGEMDRITKEPPLHNTTTGYRDALMIAMLICCPTMRLGNLTMIRVGVHLRRLSDAYQLVFNPEETKTRTPLTIPVPESLSSYLDHYIDHVRPNLPKADESDRLWITRYGRPMRDKAVYAAITKTTKRAFGVAINPHLFRDCAVTTVAIEDPEHIGIAAPILGHTDPRTTEKHYIQANSLVAARKLRSSVDALRRQYHPRIRRKDLSEGG
jgi:integrase/recombinase XerD